MSFRINARVAVVSAVVMCGPAFGQAYPAKPIRIVTSEIGGGADFVARLVLPSLSTNFGQQLIVDNRGSGVIPGETVSRAPPDGYTVLVHGGAFYLAPLFRATPFDPLKDFVPVTLIATSPTVLAVHPSLPSKSVRDLIALAKARPGDMNYGSSSPSAASTLAAELFKSMAQVNIVRVNYKGNGPALNGLISGEVQLMFGSSAQVKPHMASGKLRGIGVGSLTPSALAPGLPPIAESGLPGYEASSRFGLFAPARTPDAVVNRLNQDFVRVLNQPEIKDKLLATGLEAVGNSSQEFGVALKTEIGRMAKVIKDAGIRAD